MRTVKLTIEVPDIAIAAAAFNVKHQLTEEQWEQLCKEPISIPNDNKLLQDDKALLFLACVALSTLKD